jgi:GT2 family glycosyltransferase
MDLSIVIVNWNGKTVLEACLTSIYANQPIVNFEVIVVDNDSKDDSVIVVRSKFPDVRLICNDQNLGFAAGNNRGFNIARGRYVLLLNNDTIVLPNALQDSVEYLDSNPEVGALGCRIEYPDRSFQTSCYRLNDPFVMLMTRLLPIGSLAGERLNYGRYWARQFKQPTDVDVVAGCFMLVRREVLEGVGGLDEDFFMYGEDEEWCARIHTAGWRIVYYPIATIIHIHRFSSNQARRALRVIECMSPMLVLHKRRGFWAAWVGNLVMLAAMLLRMPIWLPLDFLHVLRGTAQRGLISSRFAALAAHLGGLLRPVWLPAAAHAGQSNVAKTHR